MTNIIHENYVLIECDSPDTLTINFERGRPTRYYIENQLIDLLPFYDWQCIGKVSAALFQPTEAEFTLLDKYGLSHDNTILFKQKAAITN